MWRLFATLLTVSDVGSVSVSQTNSDWPDQQSCEMAIQQLYQLRSDKTEMMGHRIQARAEAKCIPVGRTINEVRIPNPYLYFGMRPR